MTPFDGKCPTFCLTATVTFAFSAFSCQKQLEKFGLENLGKDHWVHHLQRSHSMSNINLCKNHAWVFFASWTHVERQLLCVCKLLREPYNFGQIAKIFRCHVTPKRLDLSQQILPHVRVLTNELQQCRSPSMFAFLLLLLSKTKSVKLKPNFK